MLVPPVSQYQYTVLNVEEPVGSWGSSVHSSALFIDTERLISHTEWGLSMVTHPPGWLLLIAGRLIAFTRQMTSRFSHHFMATFDVQTS